jgi:hypothetical protein
MKTAHLGQKVRHNFSKEVGEITQLRQDPKGYCFYVEWDDEPERNDWYKLKALEAV